MLEPEMLDFIRATEAALPADAAACSHAEQRRLYDAYRTRSAVRRWRQRWREAKFCRQSFGASLYESL